MRRYRFAVLLLLLLLSACRPEMAARSTQVPSTPVPVLASPSLASLTFTPLSPTPLPPVEISPTPVPTAVPTSTPTPLPRTSLVFTGVIVPARCVQAAIDARRDPDYPYEEVREILSSADLAVGTLNATISDYPPRTGCIPTYVLVGGSENAGALSRAGFDVMSVATNHIKNCGPANCGNRAFFDTLENLRRAGTEPVGAGRDLEEAMQPVVVEANGTRFGFVSLGQLEPLAFAGTDTPGIAVLDEGSLRRAIAAARQVSDVVIAMPHWGPEDSPQPNASQRALAQVAVDAGADLVVGNHTHVVQALEQIDGVNVFYGLGNFVFDQNWALDHQQGVILRVNFEGEQVVGYELISTHVDFDGTVHLAGPQESGEILQRVEDASRNLR